MRKKEENTTKKLCYNDLLKQLIKDPRLTKDEVLKDIRIWIDYIEENFGNVPLGLLQAYAYILEEMRKEAEEDLKKGEG